jgi:DUF1365 family protein
MTSVTPVTAYLYECVVRHTRSAPVRHAFAHRTYQWLVDLDHLPRPRWPLAALARFRAKDHFGDPASTIRANVDAFLAANGIDLRGGRVLMLANARVLGYVFNPLSVFWVYYSDGSLAAVIAEVHNTYGERHCYLLPAAGDGRYATDKDFYVSPFYEVAGVYRMHLPEPGQRLSLAIRLTPPDGRPFAATLRGCRRPAKPAAIIATAIRYPWATVVVTLRIRWHGIRLLLRGLPVVPRPAHRSQEGVQ